MLLESMEKYALKLSTDWELDALEKYGKLGTEVFSKQGAGCVWKVWKGMH